jgi:hypothetical protein
VLNRSTSPASVASGLVLAARLLKLGQPVVTEPCFVRRLLVLAPRELLVQALLALPQQLRQRCNPLRHRRPREVDEGNPGLEAVGHHTVLHAPEPPVGQHLQKPACPSVSTHTIMQQIDVHHTMVHECPVAAVVLGPCCTLLSPVVRTADLKSFF